MALGRCFIPSLKPSLWASIFLTIALRYHLRISLTFIYTLFRRLLGFGSVTLTSSRKTVPISLTDGRSEDQPQSLRGLVEGIVTPIRLNPLIFNGHIHTICVGIGWGGTDYHVHYKRKCWQSNNKFYPGHFTVDFVIPTPIKPFPRDPELPPRTHYLEENEWSEFINEDYERPLVIILHGFLGGSHEKYIRHSLELLTAGGKDAEFSVAVINARGCCYSRLTTPILYHPRATWDLRQFIQWARGQWPRRRMFAVGFSIGANLLCNYLGEEGEACELEAAILVGNPWNLDVTNTLLTNSTAGLYLYQRALGSAFRKTFERHFEVISQNLAIDVKKARESTYLWQWDRYVQCPSWGYPSEHSYYRDVSSADAVAAIRIPVLALHAQDDPVCSDLAVPYHLIETNPYIVMCASSIGGHLGWFEPGGGRWSNKMIYAFLRKVGIEAKGIERQSSATNGAVVVGSEELGGPIFNPVQRKLFWPESIAV